MALPLLLLACHTPDSGEEEGVDTTDYPPAALIVVLDGVRVEEWSSADRVSDLTGVVGQEYARDFWAKVVPDAAVVRTAYNSGITITAPGHLEMLTGRVDPFANYGIEAEGAGWYRPEHPTLFEEVRDQLGLTAPNDVVLLANTELLMPATASVHPGYGEAVGATYHEIFDQEKPDAPANDDVPVVDALKDHVKNDHPRLMLVNLHDVDRSGHYGADDAYAGDVQKLDDLLAEFWRWLADHQPGYRDELLVVVTADHGRHRHDQDSGWRNHGDACTGCREVPMFFAGAGARAGEEVEGAMVTLLDVGPTVAAHLGVELPYAEGLPIAPAFDALDAPARSGTVDLLGGRRHVIGTRWVDDYSRRSEVLWDDAVLSTTGVFAARVASFSDSPSGGFACIRELDFPAEAASWPWTPRCFEDVGGSPVDVDFPETEVGLTWSPRFFTVGTETWVAYEHNPNGIGELGANDEVGIRARRLEDSTWSEPWSMPTLFPVGITGVELEDAAVIAFGTNELGETSRYTRHVEIVRLTADGDGLTGSVPVRVDLEPFLGAGGRAERSAMTRLANDVLVLAVQGYGDAARDVYLVDSTDNGRTWHDPQPVGSANPPVPWLAPVWDGDVLFWAAQGPDEAEICRKLGDGDATCAGVGSARLDSFAVQDGTILASVDAGVGAWEVRAVTVE